jgi:hypothetical protein
MYDMFDSIKYIKVSPKVMQRTITEKSSGIFVFARSSFAGGEELGM